MVDKLQEAELLYDCSDRHTLEVRKFRHLVVGRRSRRKSIVIVAVVVISTMQRSEFSNLVAVQVLTNVAAVRPR
jgi:hypothetical protein